MLDDDYMSEALKGYIYVIRHNYKIDSKQN